MKILFKVIVLVSVFVCCYILWKLYNNFNINKGQFALAYGLVILVGSLFVGWLTDFDFKNQSLYDNREADPLSDWVKIQDRAKGKGDFWKGLVSDSNMDELLQWELSNQYDSKELKHEPPYIPGRPTANYYDRSELKSVGQIIKEYKLDQPKNTFRPMLVVDEVHKGNAETIKRIAEEVETELRQPYEPYAGCWIEQEKELGRIVTAQQKEDKLYNMPFADRYNDESIKQPKNPYFKGLPSWVTNEAGDAVNPLDHEQSK